jgi:ABC-type antimicrobial peptide transport system permease subunit
MPAADLRAALEPLVESGELEVWLGDVRSLETLTDALIDQDRTRGLLTIAAAVLIVLLTTLGFYGTQQLLLRASLREFAIRASLGAGPASLGRRVLVRGFDLGLPGVAIGGLLAFVAVAWLSGEYVADSISPALIATATVAALIVLLVAASIGPARRARLLQPAPLLREEP